MQLSGQVREKVRLPCGPDSPEVTFTSQSLLLSLTGLHETHLQIPTSIAHDHIIPHATRPSTECTSARELEDMAPANDSRTLDSTVVSKQMPQLCLS